jgi:hypothetical protein
MDDDANATDAAPSQRSRFRFGLKTLFVVTTVLCLWLGYKFLRERRVAEMVARHEEVLAKLVSQIDSSNSPVLHGITPGPEGQLLYGQRVTI